MCTWLQAQRVGRGSKGLARSQCCECAVASALDSGCKPPCIAIKLAAKIEHYCEQAIHHHNGRRTMKFSRRWTPLVMAQTDGISDD
jgi:hypothetical protein